MTNLILLLHDTGEGKEDSGNEGSEKEKGAGADESKNARTQGSAEARVAVEKEQWSPEWSARFILMGENWKLWFRELLRK